MANDLVWPPGDSSPVGPPRRGELSRYWNDARDHEASPFDLSTLLRILHEWRWLILGAVALGLAAAIMVTLLTQPLYRAWVTLEVNPPTVEVMDDEKGEQPFAQTTWDYISTQAGLLSSRSLAERVAQDLNLAANAELVGTGGDAAARLKTAAARVAGGLNVETPEEGQLIRFSYEAESPQLAASVANGIAEAFIKSSLQRRFDASAYARKFLEKEIAKTRGDLERSERQLVGYAQAQGIINIGTAGSGEAPTDANSLRANR